MSYKIDSVQAKVIWTRHVEEKMRYYGLSKQRVMRVLKHPERCEEAIAPGCVACMQTLGKKSKTEIWVMYIYKIKNQKNKTEKMPVVWKEIKGSVKLITAWRYPGVSPKGEQIPMPAEIKNEIKSVVLENI